MELSVSPPGLLPLDSSWPRMLKCSLVFTQSALTGAVSEADAAAAAAAAFTGPQSGDYSLITRIKVKMKLGLMQGKPKIDSPLLLTQSEV